MKVILLENISRLGQMGDIVNVEPSFARRFLLPQKKALRATDANRKSFEETRQQLEALNSERKSEAQKIARKIAGITVVLVRAAGESGQLYGSVTDRDIANAVSDAGLIVSRRQVALDRPIRQLGLEPVRLFLHPEVTVEIIVNIARSKEEAEIQATLGQALVEKSIDDQNNEEEISKHTLNKIDTSFKDFIDNLNYKQKAEIHAVATLVSQSISEIDKGILKTDRMLRIFENVD
nr:50S ribosomal protein L9 [Hyphomonas sp. UBA1923]|tara:strand:+ start:12681 stop:13385 length:705 start_codon:yes stop_codon:yes gene_type:complete